MGSAVRTRAWWLPVGAAALLSLASASSALAQSPSAGTESPSGSAGALPEIVWLEQNAGNPYWDAQHAAAEEAGERLGFSFRAVSGNGDPAQQAATLQQLVDQRPAAIMLNSLDPTATAPGVQYAKDNGVPVVNLYGMDPNATASIAFDEIKVGENAAKHALTLLEQRYGSPTGTIAILTGVQGQPASDDRAKGFTDYMATQEGVEVVAEQPTNWSADEASATMQNWLVAYPELSMVYALSDTLAVPAMEVAERQNRLCTQEANWEASPECIIFVAVDGIFVDQVVQGRLYATQLYSPEWSGFQFANVAYPVATGGEFPTETLLNALMTTPENAECVAQMQGEMVSDLDNFPFEGTLQEIAQARGCTLVDPA
jgi:ribose transport system substrate-binding protein